MYILKCSDNSYYTGSKNNLDRKFEQHQNGEEALHTKNRLPVTLAYFEEFDRMDKAFYRKKIVQKWSRAKKEALISGKFYKLKSVSECKNDSHSKNLRKK